MRKVLAGFSFSGDLYQFKDEDFARIAEALDIKTLDDEQRQHLQKICDEWGPISRSWNLASSPKDIKTWLKKIQSGSGALLETLNDMHRGEGPDRPARESAIEFLHTAAPGNDWAKSLTDLLNIQEQVFALFNAAVDAQKLLPKDKGGGTGDWPQEELVNSLAAFYKKSFGEEPKIYFSSHRNNEYEGPFLSLVESFLNPLSEYSFSQRNHQGLGKFVQRILKNKKDTTPSE